MMPGDTEATLSQRVLVQEHVIYPLAVNWFCAGRLRCEAGKALAWTAASLSEPVQTERHRAGEIFDEARPRAALLPGIGAAADCAAGAAQPDDAGIAPFIAHYQAALEEASVSAPAISN